MDINGDGYTDILTGTYCPGAVYLWKGSKDGFLPRKEVPQDEDISDKYFTSITLGDINGDGLLDLFTGGLGGNIKVALNVGSKDNPRFGMRKPLYVKDTQGTSKMAIPNSHKQMPTVTDFDNDGIIDLLVTNTYSYSNNNPVTFFKGYKDEESSEIKFYEGKSIFRNSGKSRKLFPGCCVNICPVDYNNDGIKDLLVGLSIPTIKGKVYNKLTYEWLKSMGINTPGKDAGKAMPKDKSAFLKSKSNPNGFSQEELDKMTIEKAYIAKAKQDSFYKSFYMGKLDDYNAMLLRHRGLVYVMYGK